MTTRTAPAPDRGPTTGAGGAARGPLDTPIGRLVVDAGPDGLTHLTLPGTRPPRPGPPEGPGSGPAAHHLARGIDELTEYFAGRRRSFDVALDPAGTEFQLDVWFALADIPYGRTISYAELAARVGRPTAFRAVGQANGANPLAIILPCHRVVASGGGIGGYGGGLPMKRKLLALEASAADG